MKAISTMTLSVCIFVRTGVDSSHYSSHIKIEQKSSQGTRVIRRRGTWLSELLTHLCVRSAVLTSINLRE
jgi:hypothetical protein